MSEKVVLITGASSGIGKALAEAYSKFGYNLILAARNLEELEQNKNDLEINGSKILLHRTDVTKDEDCLQLINSAISKFNKIDILINNAGISQRSLAKNTKIEVDRQIMDVNYFGSICITKYALPHMIRSKNGHIVVISSIVGKFGFPLRSGYAASKHALGGYFESLRAELYKENIDVTIVFPGRIKTNISLNALTQDGSKYKKMDDGQAQGVSAVKCANSIIQSIKKKKKEVIIGGKETNLIHIRRFLPSLFYKIIQNIKPV